MSEEQQLDYQSESWRDEITSRVHNYRHRRGKRLSGEYSMELEFEAPHATGHVYAGSVAATAAVRQDEPVRAHIPRAFRNLVLNEEPVAASAEPAIQEQAGSPVEPEFAPLPEPEPEQQSFIAEEPEPAPPVPPTVRRRRSSHTEPKIIEFPRSANYSMFPSPDELAEPVLERPRILDVPETVPAPEPSMLADIQLEPEPEPVFDTQIEVPPRVASVPVRVSAALVDWFLVIVASGIFAMIAHALCGDIAVTKPVLAFILALPCFLWALYQYLFMVYGGRTPGMKSVQLDLKSFDGSPVRRHTRRVRALMMVISCVSVGMGFMSAVLDEDSLCWHDRVTRTYLGRQ